ncbi:ADP-heptose--lipooligosaccharide heptosyltransferase II [Castellaniella defragrans 65Phen]|jgi:ADP-heptose:LPS heptosyltransferase|uniref:ADP-heptose--lipooligosaccharide heptosyltransferase II n=1 Tax=Castellaniella defragrans (strain DSM 12143 / CCUG 39792 / 65Phen) TaxID=1437824 RepID=W8X5F6_CASD6|nr:glycosyltransferase family 9 protein [Castellaniella defragrans]CDM25136.1 ADP-heptose--lipooligosaccharide heptosyltransferase II [Castellaniella defragrans 65Phen]
MSARRREGAPGARSDAARPADPWRDARAILCVRLDNLGDVLMTTPALRALRRSARGRRITLLASRAGAALAPYVPEVDEVVAYDAPWVKNAADDPAEDRRMIEALRQRNFDAAVIFTVYSQSPLPAAMMCRLAGIPRVLAHAHENPYRLLSHWVRDPEPGQYVRHEVQRQLDLVATVGAACTDTRLSFATQDADRRSLGAILAAYGLGGGQGWIVAHCGASAPSRRYNPALYARAISLLHGCGLKILLTGGPGECALTAGILAQCTVRSHVIDLAGRLTLGELACLIEDARLLISNNTGPAHIAAAVGTPLVDLYALTNPQHQPWQVPHRLLYHDVPCRNCYSSVCREGTHACLEGVDPRRVVAAAHELLAWRAGVSPRPLVA